MNELPCKLEIQECLQNEYLPFKTANCYAKKENESNDNMTLLAIEKTL